MSYIDVNSGQVIAHADGNTRQKFIRKTYLHLAAAIALFAVLETVMIQAGLGVAALKMLNAIGGFGWLGVLLVYGIASSFVHRAALNAVSIEKQYTMWFVGVFIESVIFLPLIMMALLYSKDISFLQHAAIATLALVAGLTAVVFTTGKDFSFLRPALAIGFFVAIGLIVTSVLFGFSLGLFFIGAMIIFAAAAILYETSQIQHHYHETQYVGASLSLFASVGMLFWYILHFFMSFND